MSMGRFERMVALPEEEYHSLKSLQNASNPLQTKFRSLSSDYQKQGLIHDPYTRVQRQGETLNEMKNLKSELSKRLLALTPKPYQTRAQSLFNFIESKMPINDRGEVMKADGTVIGGSNIADLIQHAVRDRRRNIIPVGWNYFLSILRDSNTPRMIMNYETLEEMVTPTVKKETTSTSPFMFTAPKSTLSPTHKSPLKRKHASSIKKRESTTREKKEPDYLKDYLVAGSKRKKYF